MKSYAFKHSKRNLLLKIIQRLCYATRNGIVHNSSEKPSLGGLWEASVRRMKHHLRRAMVKQILTHDEFNTLLTQIEAILNLRPLTELSTDPNVFLPLTPGHSLIGRALNEFTFERNSDAKVTLNVCFKLLENLNAAFWKSCSQDYLVYLQVRKKWPNKGEKFKENELVLIAEDNIKHLLCEMGRIIKT